MKKLFDRYWWVGSIILAVTLIAIVDQAPRIFRIERPTAEPVSIDSDVLTETTGVGAWVQPADRGTGLLGQRFEFNLGPPGLMYWDNLKKEYIVENLDKVFFMLDGKKVNLAEWIRSRNRITENNPTLDLTDLPRAEGQGNDP